MLFTALSIFLGLIALYLIGRYVPLVREGLVFGCVLVASPFIWCEQALKTGYTWLLRRYHTTIQTIANDKETGVSLETALLSRLLWFIFAAVLVLSDGFGILAAAPALFRTTAYVALPEWLMTASAWAFLIAPLVFGAVISELALGHALGERLFPSSLSTGAKWLYTVYSAVGFVFSLVIICYFALFRAIYIDPVLKKSVLPIELSNISVIVFVGQIVVLIAALALCIHALIKGGIILVFGIIPGVCCLFCSLASFLCSLLPRFLDIISLSVSGGARSVYDTVSGALHITREGTLPFSHTILYQEDGITPLALNQEEDTMISTKQRASLVFGGSFGTLAYPIFMQQLASIAPYARDVVFTSAHLDLDHEPQQTGRKGDISPSPKDRHQIMQRQAEQAYSTLFEETGKKQVAAHLAYTGTPACFVYVLDCRIIHHTEAMLRHVHSHLKEHKLIVFTSFSARDLRDETVVKNLHLLNTLYRQGVVATTLVINSTSPFVVTGKHSKDTQLAFAARAIIGLLTAHTFSTHDWTNPSSVRLITDLSRSFPLLSLSFASDYVQANPPHGVGLLVSFLQKARTGDIAHALQQARLLTETVLSPDTNATRACKEPVNPYHDAVLLCHTPLPLDRHFAAFAKEYQRGLPDSCTHFAVVVVSGNGTPYPEKPQRDFLLQVTCFYPLGKVLPDEIAHENEQVLDTASPLALPVPPAQTEARHDKKPDTEPAEPMHLPQLVPVPAAKADTHQNNGVRPPTTKRGRPKKQTTQDKDKKEQ